MTFCARAQNLLTLLTAHPMWGATLRMRSACRTSRNIIDPRKDVRVITSLQPSVPRASNLTKDVENQLLLNVGVAPAQASPTELMQSISQVARRLLSRRWVETQAAQR